MHEHSIQQSVDKVAVRPSLGNGGGAAANRNLSTNTSVKAYALPGTFQS